jgi:hypothetical protein
MDASAVSMVVGRYQNDSSFVDKFSENTTDTVQFYTDGQTKEIKKHRYFYRWIIQNLET